MKTFAGALTVVVGVLGCSSASACPAAAIAERVEISAGNLTLADLLLPGSCPQLRQAAARVKLGAAPRPGTARVLEGGEVRAWIEPMRRREELAGETDLRIPERIEVRRAGESQSCSEIAQFLGGQFRAVAVAHPGWVHPRSPGFADAWTAPGNDMALPSALDCAGARHIPRQAGLAVVSSKWNPALRRWEFALRCRRAEDCVPFLVWTRANAPPDEGSQPAQPAVSTPASTHPAERVMQAGQSAMLSWTQGGIRVVLPVTSLDAGAAGQWVRVRLKNNERILSAEVVDAGNVRLSF